jgi:hypothetical protein
MMDGTPPAARWHPARPALDTARSSRSHDYAGIQEIFDLNDLHAEIDDYFESLEKLGV